MPWAVAGAAVAAAGSVAASSISANAAAGGAKQQQSALAQAASADNQGYNEAQNYLNPYYQSGLQDQTLYNSILTGTPISQQAGFNQAFGGPVAGNLGSTLPTNIQNALKSFTSKSPNLEYPDGSQAFVNHQVTQLAGLDPTKYAQELANLGLDPSTDQSVFKNAAAGVGGATQPLTGDFALANNIGTSPGGTTNGGQYAAFFNSPDYQFALQQGLSALDNSASAKGNLQSGAQQIGITNYAQGLASQQYNSFMSKLQQQATGGQQAGGALANAALGQGSALAGLTAQSGNVGAAGTVGQANALNSGIQNLTGSYGVGSAGGLQGALGGGSGLSGILSSLGGGSGSSGYYGGATNAQDSLHNIFADA